MLTPEDMEDPRKRIEGLYWITDKNGLRIPFELNGPQRELLDSLHGRDVILKARQLGMTTVMCIVALDECLFNPNWRAAIIAHKLEDAKGIFESKVKFAYDNLDEGLRARIPTNRDSADTLHFANGSSISVTTSARSGTLQRLHVSEFGKICAQFPQKAREIISGSFPATERGFITIESTAEGQEGKFYEITQMARDNEGKPHGPKDFKFHFFPWFRDAGYTYDPKLVTFTPEADNYFGLLEADGIKLTEKQKAWWIKTEREQGGDMKREYPATPDEAFEQAIEGAYFEKQLAHAAKVGNVGKFPYDPRFEVNTFWDLGRNDMTTIWLHQHVDRRNRFIGYYEASGEHISHYVLHLREWARKMDRLKWGEHYWPHDGDRDDLFLEQGRLAEVDKLGFRPRIVPRPQVKLEAIDTARARFADCDFDDAGCSLGLRRLRHFRKEWDELRGVWRDRPRHDENSHGADAFLTFACGWQDPRPMKAHKRKVREPWAA